MHLSPKKEYLAIIVIIIAVSGVAIGYYLINQQTPRVDSSWIANVTQYLNDAKPYPPYKTDYTLNAYSISLFENGTSTFVNASNGNNFSSYLLSLMSRANKQLDASVSDAFVTKMVETDKVVYLRSRLGTNFIQAGTFVWDIYFVLEDNLNQGLKGTLLVEHDVNNARMWQSWAIAE